MILLFQLQLNLSMFQGDKIMCPMNTNISKTNSSTTSGRNPMQAIKNSVLGGAGGAADSSSGFEKGQNFRGEVIDLRNKTAKILLSNSKIITAKVDGKVMLSIGQQATFQVTIASGSALTLKVVHANELNSMEAAILKALDEAGLPKTERNEEAVRELLNQHLSIDKNSIYKLLQQAAAFPKASFSTLTLMARYQIPLTDLNTSQFEAYRNSEHRILQQVSALTESILELFEGNQISIADSISMHKQLLEIIMSGALDQARNSFSFDGSGNDAKLSDLARNLLINSANSIDENIKFLNQQEIFLDAGGQEELHQKNQVRQEDAFFLNGSNNIVSSKAMDESIVFLSNDRIGIDHSIQFMNNEERLAIVELLEQFKISDEHRISILTGDASIKETAHALLNGIESAYRQDGIAFPGLEVLLQDGLLPEGFSNATNLAILNKLSTQWEENGSIGRYLPQSMRDELADQLSFLRPKDQEQLRSGEFSEKSFLSAVSNKVLQEESFLSLLLGNKGYQMVLKQSLLNHWTLTPESLQRDGEVNRFYERLENDLNLLKNLADKNFSSNAGFGQKAGQLHENLDFMRTLNQLFPYVQLPMKLGGKNIHGELYVYTRKRDLMRDKKNISVLLHLDMQQLGQLDVHLELHHTIVTAKFYLEDPENILIVSENLYRLDHSLKKAGYSIHSEVLQRKKEKDLVTHFISEGEPQESIKRYNFDIRA